MNAPDTTTAGDGTVPVTVANADATDTPAMVAESATRPATPERAHFEVPTLLFENRSGLEAIQFDTVDQHGSAFHVVVAKVAYAIGARDENGLAALGAPSAPSPLRVEDSHIGDDPARGVFAESDFAPYKPACDVIVHATACAPRASPVTSFHARLRVASDTSADQSKPGRLLIDKALEVFGEREFRRKWWPRRLLGMMVKIASFGALRPPPWRLTSPARFVELALDYTQTHGGECRINADDPAAKRVPKKARLPQDATPAAPSAGAAIAHESCPANPLGRGFTRKWFLRARRIKRLPAPRLTYAAEPCEARRFWRGAAGAELPKPAGFGVVGRGWMPRRALAGTFEDKATWQADEVPMLPLDFDFGYWNCAPLDQQCPYLNGQEEITLINLCRPEHPAANINQYGHTHLRFRLPSQAVFLLAADQENKVAAVCLDLDTVIVDPAASRVELVWRICLPADGDFKQARLMRVTESAQLARLRQMEQAQEQLAEAKGKLTAKADTEADAAPATVTAPD
jgi:hypothetical protein